MIGILVIATDQRARDLVSHIQPMVHGTIIQTGTFEQGMGEVFSKRPAIVLVQQVIYGIDCKTFVSQIKSLQMADLPRFVMLCNTFVPPEESSCDAMVDLSLPQEEMTAALLKVMVTIPGFQRQQPAVAPSADGEAGASVSADAGAPAAPSPPPGPPPERTDGWRQPDRAKPGVSAAAGAKPSPPPCYLVGIPAQRPQQRPPRTRRLLPATVLFLVVAAVAIAVWLRSMHHRAATDVPARTQSSRVVQPPPKPPASAIRLPAVVEKAHRDPAYAAAHPGWMRYLTSSLEFRVFRERGALRAVQVIGLTQDAITKPFFRQFVRDLTGTPPPSLSQSTGKDGEVQESGKGGGGAEFLLYHSGRTGRIIAFVVQLP